MTEKQYIDVSNIKEKPELFLKIYDRFQEHYKFHKNLKFVNILTPQQLAQFVLQDCQKGVDYAQFLVKPENPILIVCRKENLTRKQLAELIGVKVSRLENCLSRGNASKGVRKLLAERFNYITGV